MPLSNQRPPWISSDCDNLSEHIEGDTLALQAFAKKNSHLGCFSFAHYPVAVVCRFAQKSQIFFKTRTWGDTTHENNHLGYFPFVNQLSLPLSLQNA